MRIGWRRAGAGRPAVKMIMRLNFNSRWTHRVQAALRHRPARSVTTPPLPATAAWEEAFLRVESYLRAHRIESRVLLNQRVAEIIGSARVLAQEQPEVPPVTLAMQVAHARIGEWLARAAGVSDWTDGRVRARGRLALLLADVPGRCPEQFLTGQTPEDVRVAMVTAELEPGPEVRLSRMPNAPLEFPLAAVVEENWVTFNRSAFLRGVTSWVLVAGLLGAAWYATR